MNFKDKNVIVVGLAKSGVSAIKALYDSGAVITVTDMKSESQLEEIFNEIKPYYREAILGMPPTDVKAFDIAVLSPGVPVDLPFINEMREVGTVIIGEIELAYQLCEGTFVGITGTNGKTTTTALTGEIFKASGKSHYVVGNIGIPAVSMAPIATEDTVMVTEISSFQLETIMDFRARVAAILNITPDHLNRHKTMENYTDAKARIFENQLPGDALVLNFDDLLTRQLASRAKGRVYTFSRKEVTGQSAYINDGKLILDIDGVVEPLCRVDEMKIFGSHNEENALAAALISRLAGVGTDAIIKALMTFAGVEHRIEYTKTVEDRLFYNDSKGTNPDSTICAVRAMNRPTILIAGGYDKDSDFEPIFDVFEGKIRHLILLGATREKFANAAKAKGYHQVTLVSNMEEAVHMAMKCSLPGDAVLLSPACASWDMYDNFEQRGEHFKAIVRAL
jgi:UDP-N-acetylmuramoylalanine--D-glutamate ligase